MNKLTHFDASGQAHMVNVGDKPNTHRIAVATGKITMLRSRRGFDSRQVHQKNSKCTVCDYVNAVKVLSSNK